MTIDVTEIYWSEIKLLEKHDCREGPAGFAWFDNPDGDRIRFVHEDAFTALEEENARLREALEWYADEGLWLTH